MKFSIIVPVYMAEQYLDECVESILNQTYSDFELILVDNDSPDNCGKMCDDYAVKDERVKVIHKRPNVGPAGARNAGLECVEGEYVMFVDSDDALSYQRALEDIYNTMVRNPNTDVFITKTWKHITDEVIVGSDLLTKLVNNGLKGDMFRVTIWDKVYKYSYIKQKGFRFDCNYVHDDLLWTFMTIASANECTVISYDFYKRTINNDSLTRAASEKSIYNRAFSRVNVAKIGAEYFAYNIFDKKLRNAVFEFYIGVYINGLVDGTQLKDRELIKEFKKEIKKTANVLRYGLFTQRKSYKMISVLYCIFGYAVALVLKNIIHKRR